MAMDGSNDDETSVAPQRATKHPKNASFDFDDAFSDGDDDHNPAFELSSASIREELARNHSVREAEDRIDTWAEDTSMTHASNGRLDGGSRDNSVSTIDIGGPALEYPPSPAHSSLYRTPEESDYSNEFSQVSLSEDTTPDHDNVPKEDQQDEENKDSGNDMPYPIVHIDASKPPSSRVELAPTSISPDAPLDSPPEDQDHELQPPYSAPASSSQHDISPPPSEKPPKAPVPTKPTPGHRPTRSMGPSALEKVVSKTRPAYLPPKTKQEDNKHMADWERMMQLSRSTGKFPLAPTLCKVFFCLVLTFDFFAC
jgi:hypothetical protein